MSYYIKVSGAAKLINMSKISNFNYKDPSTASVGASYEGTTLSQGNPSKYYSKISGAKTTIYAKPVSTVTNSITHVGFSVTYTNISTNQTPNYMYRFWLDGLKFAYSFTGYVKVKIVEYSSGYGTNAPATTILDKTANVRVYNSQLADSLSEEVPLKHMSTTGSLSGMRYGITITATPSNGDPAMVLSIPIMYANEVRTPLGNGSYWTQYQYHIVGPVTSNGSVVISGNIDSELTNDQGQSGSIAYDTLNLVNKTFTAMSWYGETH